METLSSIDQAMNRARELHMAGRLHDAGALYCDVLNADPNHAEAMHLLGLIYHQMRVPDRALPLLRRSIELSPAQQHFYKNLGEVARVTGQTAEAIAAFERAIALARDDGSAWLGLGRAFDSGGLPQRAAEAYREAIRLSPDDAVAHHNLGVILEREGNYDESLKLFERAIALDPNHRRAHIARGVNLLRRGDLLAGWGECAWLGGDGRFQDRPLWDGGDLGGRTIVIHADGSVNDAIQFSRYVPMVAQRGGNVVFEVPLPLESVFRNLPELGTIVPAGDSLPIFEVHAPLMSLPGIFKTDLSSIPATVPYLAAKPALIERWRERLREQRNLKVGIAWVDDSGPADSASRALGLEALAPLASVPGVTFYSLQLGRAGAEAAKPPVGMRLVEFGVEMGDLGQMAGLISVLDLVIAVEGVAAHLAGALGREVWTLIPRVADWRWLLDREDTPWYPTMRLFRQGRDGEWNDVIGRVRSALQAKVGV